MWRVRLSPVWRATRPLVRAYTALRDPDRATGLYYHRLPHGTWAVSLLERAPPSESSADVICELPTTGDAPSEYLRANPDAPRNNGTFWDALHSVLKEATADDDQLRTEAVLRTDGWAHLSDLRTEAMPGRTTPPEDIFGSVAFTDERLIPSSYERNDMYRFCVAHQGPMKLKDTWLAKVRAYLQTLP